MKKKAQHEANKIKLYGLEQEHQSLINLIRKIRVELTAKIESPNEVQQDITQNIEKLVKIQKGKGRNNLFLGLFLICFYFGPCRSPNFRTHDGIHQSRDSKFQGRELYRRTRRIDPEFQKCSDFESRCSSSSRCGGNVGNVKRIVGEKKTFDVFVVPFEGCDAA